MRYALYSGEIDFCQHLPRFRSRPQPGHVLSPARSRSLLPFCAATPAVPLAARHSTAASHWCALWFVRPELCDLPGGVRAAYLRGQDLQLLERVMGAKPGAGLDLPGLCFTVLAFVELGYPVGDSFGPLRFGALPRASSAGPRLAAFAATAGAGGSACTFSNCTRQGLGHGIPGGRDSGARLGGKSVKLSHSGKVFEITRENMIEWRGWLRHILRDQLLLWAPACVVWHGASSNALLRVHPRGSGRGRECRRGHDCRGCVCPPWKPLSGS